jgi:hypothetical protein
MEGQEQDRKELGWRAHMQTLPQMEAGLAPCAQMLLGTVR